MFAFSLEEFYFADKNTNYSGENYCFIEWPENIPSLIDDNMLVIKMKLDGIKRVIEIIQNRVDQFGVAEPTIQKQGNNRVIVELAGIEDSERARDLLQRTALLELMIAVSYTHLTLPTKRIV